MADTITSFFSAMTPMIILGLYLLPGILAHYRQHNNAVAIIVATVTTGWTGFGWIIALIWACTNNTLKRA